MKVEVVPSRFIDTAWPEITAGIEAACRRSGGDIDSHYLWTECRSGRATLFLIVAEDIIGASVWRIERWSTGQVCRCLVLYGKHMIEWKNLHYEKASELARLGHAERLVTEGRTGFAKMFPAAKVLRQTYEMRLK